MSFVSINCYRLRLSTISKSHCLVLLFAILFVAGGTLVLFSVTSKGSFSPRKFPDNIFFIESSGSPELNVRQACAVESAAIHHPHSEVRVVMFASDSFKDTFGLSHSLRNLRITVTTLEEMLADSPLWNWFRRMEWENKWLRTYGISDISKAILIWKHGGMYLDLDTVTLRPLYGKCNFLVRQDVSSVASGVFCLEKNHPFLSTYLEMVPKEHSKGVWGSLGPNSLFNKAYESFTKQKLSEKGLLKYGVPFLSNFSAVQFSAWQEYFDRTRAKFALEKMKNAYIIHVWNMLSKERRLSIDSGSAYEQAVKENCPVVYDYIVRSTMANSSFVF